jgi:hypothetical protein
MDHSAGALRLAVSQRPDDSPHLALRPATARAESSAVMLDMRVIFTDVSAGLRDLPSVETEGSAWLLLIRV